jgi:hypothetical protein
MQFMHICAESGDGMVGVDKMGKMEDTAHVDARRRLILPGCHDVLSPTVQLYANCEIRIQEPLPNHLLEILSHPRLSPKQQLGPTFPKRYSSQFVNSPLNPMSPCRHQSSNRFLASPTLKMTNNERLPEGSSPMINECIFCHRTP